MARQRTKYKHVRKLGQTGNAESPSYYVTLPIDIIRELKWKDGQRVVVKKSRNRIVIEDFQLK